MKKLDILYYVLAITFGIICVVAFFITFPQGNLYGIIGSFVASFGFLTGAIVHLIQKLKRINKNNKNDK